MNKEEKKAIERAKFLNNIDTYLEKEMLTNLLNLIEKQRQEIEELKDRQEYSRLEKEQLLEDVHKDYISKDKIRDKIKELEEIGQMLAAEQGYWGNPKLLNQMEILKELLGE